MQAPVRFVPGAVTTKQYVTGGLTVLTGMLAAYYFNEFVKPIKMSTNHTLTPHTRSLGKGRMTTLEEEDIPRPYDLMPTIAKLYPNGIMNSKPICLPLGMHDLEALKFSDYKSSEKK